MKAQQSLFDPQNLASTVVIPNAPALVAHSWPFPGLTPEDSARAAWSGSEEYADMLAAVIQSQGGSEITSQQVLALVPADWRELLGQFAHGSIGWTQGEQRGIKTKYVPHDGGGFHFTFQADSIDLLRIAA
jgi:hypothetical protein